MKLAEPSRARSIPIVISHPGEGPPPTAAFRRSPVRWATVILASVLPGFISFGGVVSNTAHGWKKIANGIALLAFAILGIRIARLGIFAGPGGKLA